MSSFENVVGYQFKAIIKDPSAHLDYSEDWRSWLASGETITSVAVGIDVVGELVDAGHSQASGVVTVWLDGGVALSDYTVAITITTSVGRIDTRRFVVRVRQR